MNSEVAEPFVLVGTSYVIEKSCGNKSLQSSIKLSVTVLSDVGFLDNYSMTTLSIVVVFTIKHTHQNFTYIFHYVFLRSYSLLLF